MLQRLRSFIPLGVLLLGYLLSEPLYPLSPVIPYIITAMLFMTFLKVRPRDLRFQRSHLYLLLVQLALAGIAYLAARWWHADAATSMLLCFLTPAATAGPSIVLILKGDTAYVTTYVLITHAALIVLAPFVFPLVSGLETASSLWQEMGHIFYHVARLIVPAIVAAWLLAWWQPRLAERWGSLAGVSYMLWLSSLLLLIAHTTVYLRTQSDIGPEDLGLVAGLGLVTCVLQYLLGHWLAPRLGIEQHAGRHSLGQKNTSLSIWIAAIFLPPLAGIGITSYIIWQNIVISLVMARYRR